MIWPFEGKFRWQEKGKGRRALLLVLLIMLVCRQNVLADSVLRDSWELTADRLLYQQNPQTYTAEGDVVLVGASQSGNEMRLTADWLSFSVDDQQIRARGHVLLVSREEQISAEEVDILVDEEKGELLHTSIKIPGNDLIFLGDSARKSGPYSYSFENGYVTACPFEEGTSPPWSIHAADTELTMEGYAVMKHVTFHVKEVPVFYSPYLVLPAKTIRETGFLFPEISHSERDGLGLIAPFFVNLSSSSDVTLYPGYLSERGNFAGGEFRYVAGLQSRGTFMANFLDDRRQDSAEDDFNGDGYYRQTNGRYWLRAKADNRFNDTVAAKLDLDVVSDRDYLQEYRDGMVGFDQSNAVFFKNYHRDLQEASIPFRQSTLQATKSWNRYFAGVEMLAVKDVWDTPVAASPLQVMPRLVSDGVLPLERLPLTSQLLWQTEYIDYWREEGIGAHRLQLAPQLVTNLPLGRWLEGSLRLGFNETLYMAERYGDDTPDWPHEDLQHRTLWSFGGTVGTSLSRFYGNLPTENTGLLHLLRPEIDYSFVPDKDQGDLPDLDGQDRIREQNWLRYGVTNYFRLSETENGSARNRKIALLRLSQTYDVKEAHRDLAAGAARYPFSDLHLESELYPSTTVDLGYDTTWSVHGQGITSYDLALRWHGSERGALSASYWFRKDREQEEPYFHRQEPLVSARAISLAGDFSLTEQLLMKGSLSHSFTEEKTRETRLQLIYAPSCWAVETQYTRSLNDTRIAVLFSLAGLGKLLELDF